MALAQYETSVFINCPFDDTYRPMFRALVYTVLACGFIPRCALEISDAADVRIEKICRIIEECRLGFHDISRVELDVMTDLPRFNMPLELGLFLGCKRFGDKRQKLKSCIILDVEQYRFQKYLSDIAGQDIAAHANDVSALIKRVRDWLSAHVTGVPLLGGQAICDRYETFKAELPKICRSLQLEEPALTFTDLVYVAKEASR